MYKKILTSFYREINTKIFTFSMIKSYLTCPRSFFFRYCMFLSPLKTPNYFKFGSIFHDKIASLLQPKIIDPSSSPYLSEKELLNNLLFNLEKYKIKNDNIFANENDEIITDTASKIAYNILKTTNIISVEETACYDIAQRLNIPGGLIIGKIDAVLEEDKNFIILDHKTSARAHSKFILPYTYQFVIYNTFFKKNIKSIKCLVVLKPTIRLKKNETPHEFIKRLGEWYYTDTDTKIFILTYTPDPPLINELTAHCFNTISKIDGIHSKIIYAASDKNWEKTYRHLPPSFTNCYQCQYKSLCHNELNYYAGDNLSLIYENSLYGTATTPPLFHVKHPFLELI